MNNVTENKKPNTKTRRHAERKLKAVPTVPPPRERQDPAIALLGATGDCGIMDMDEHTAGDLLVVALDAAPWMCLGESIRAIAHELHFIADAYESGHAADYHDLIPAAVFGSIMHRLLVLAELEDRTRQHYTKRIDALEAEVAALKGGAS